MTATPYQSRVGFFLSTESWKLDMLISVSFYKVAMSFFPFISQVLIIIILTVIISLCRAILMY